MRGIGGGGRAPVCYDPGPAGRSRRRDQRALCRPRPGGRPIAGGGAADDRGATCRKGARAAGAGDRQEKRGQCGDGAPERVGQESSAGFGETSIENIIGSLPNAVEAPAAVAAGAGVPPNRIQTAPAAGARVSLSPGGDRLLQVIAAAGGAKAPVHETFVRLSRDGVTATIPLEQLVADPAEDIYAQPGDVLTLVRVPQTFSVFGATGRNAEDRLRRAKDHAQRGAREIARIAR